MLLSLQSKDALKGWLQEPVSGPKFSQAEPASMDELHTITFSWHHGRRRERPHSETLQPAQKPMTPKETYV